MQQVQPSVFARDHTFLGVCEALGEDFRFNPIYLRVPLAVALLWAPLGVLAVYAGAGVLVALTRWLVPNPAPAAAESESVPVPAPAETEAFEAEPVPLAA